MGLSAKNSSWQAKQSIPHTTVTLCGDCVKICEDFAANLGDKNWLLYHDNAPSHTSFFTRELLAKKKKGLVPPTHHYFFSVAACPT
jgi:hypothetical protein